MKRALTSIAVAISIAGVDARAEITGTDLSCVADRFGSSMNCTANEFGVTTDISIDPGSECDLGELTVVDSTAQIEGGNSDRYDIAIYIGQNGNDPREFNTGELCSVTIGPTSGAGTFWVDSDGDVAGDYDSNAVTVPPNTTPMDLTGIKLRCQADAADNLAVPFVLSYSQSSTNDISGPDDIDLVPGTSSKCSSGLFLAPGMTFYGHIDVVKNTLPPGSPQAFDFSVSTTSGAPFSPASFSLTDTQTQRIRAQVVNTVRQFTITEAATPGWTLDSINCTSNAGSGPVSTSVDLANREVTVDLTSSAYGATCVFTNRTALADLSVTKTDGTPTYTPGTSNTYVVTASNDGPDDVSGATVADTFPAGVTLSGPWTCVAAGGATCGAPSGGSPGDGSFSDTADIPFGGVVTYTLPVLYSADEADY